MTILEQIVEVKKEEVKILKRDFSVSRFSDCEFFARRPISLMNKFETEKGLSIIAEIKKASPSKGIIKENFNHIEIANVYFENNVEAVSVLTDEKFFRGNTKYLNEIARFKSAPLLRKDFIIDAMQVYQSKSIGADLILLIAEILSPVQISELTSAAHELGLEVLLELHSDTQIPKINFNTNKLIGINNRNLDTFQVDLSTTGNISKQLPEYVHVVSESGIKTKTDIDLLKNETGANAILVGEHLMSANNLDSSLKELIGWCKNEN
ncbi:MAG: indole-3-glycerol phosphate synthase TrpC [bacterium]